MSSYTDTGKNGRKNLPPIVWVLVAAIAVLLVLLVVFLKKEAAPTSAASKPASVASTPEPHVHSWVAATCTEDGYCKTCGTVGNRASGHNWSPATCTRPAVCTICGETRGVALGHSWVAATSTAPRTCSVCGETDGLPVTPPPTQTASKSADPELFQVNTNYSKYYSVQVAHGSKLDNCQSVVRHLRDSGYNAFLYEGEIGKGYSILIGVFSSSEDAAAFSEYLHGQPAVRGAKLESAYVLKSVYLNDSAAARYSERWY